MHPDFHQVGGRPAWRRRLLMTTARISRGIVFVRQTNRGAIFTATPQGKLSRPLDDPNVSDSRIDGQFIERSRDHAIISSVGP